MIPIQLCGKLKWAILLYVLVNYIYVASFTWERYV